MRIVILNQEEYTILHERRKQRTNEEQRKQISKYTYDKETTEKLLAERDLEKERKDLKRRWFHQYCGILALTFAAGLCCPWTKSTARRVADVAVISLASLAVVVIHRRHFERKLEKKDREIACAKEGYISPVLEMERER